MSQAEEQVVLVDEQGNELGLMGKTEAHEKGILHKAISVLIYNSKGEMLIQQRALTKYHWAGIWSNTCCSHPRAGETFADAAQRRLIEELGIDTPLKKEFYFIYRATDQKSGLTEHEYDWVFTGIFDDAFEYNTHEINAVKWISKDDLENDMKANPDQYSFWFPIILDNMKNRNAEKHS
jgi:isopentenyl-diphosphate delta-isomerase